MKKITPEKTEIPKPPIYNDSETVIEYKLRFDEYTLNLAKIKYDVILKFLNIWLNPYKIQLKKLTEFKRIDFDVITKNRKHNNSVLKEYSKELIEYFGIKSESYDTTKDDDIEDDEIISFVKKMLKKIDYDFTKKYVQDKTYFSIVCKRTL
ncbi:hypothetical protein Catovirus_2_152 [Catovirus CTV1]|uniref:Uncharacterized protein n=1 Tax=Catovirus CTV1 TaxID=1977631 RepID=A0A1V0SBW7_9VIRU|nr:hypothetical protein Catovirus_2_152 [Catovirus CTV1]